MSMYYQNGGFEKSNNSNITNNSSGYHFIPTGYHFIPTCYDLSVRADTLNGQLILLVKYLAILFILVTNIAVIVGIVKTKQLQLFSYKLLVVICFTDLFLGVFSVPVSIMVTYRIPSCQLVTVSRQLEIGLGYFAFVNMMCLSLDRYIFVTKQEIYKKLTNNARFMLTLFSSIAISTMITMYSDCAWNTEDFRLQMANQLCLLSCVQGFIFLLMLIMNCLLVRYVRKSAKVMKAKSQNVSRRNYENKVTQTIAIITLIFVVTNFPCLISAIYSAVRLYKRQATINEIGNLFIWVKTPLLLNAGLNGVVVIIKNTKIKGYYRKMFTSRVGTLESSNDLP